MQPLDESSKAESPVNWESQRGIFPVDRKGILWVFRLGLLSALLLLWWTSSPGGLSTFDLQMFVLATAPLAIAAMAQTLPIVAGGQGLSAGATLVLASSVVARLPTSTPLEAGFAVASGLLVGAGVGLTNGILIGILGLRSTPVTLATGAAAMAVALQHSASGTVEMSDGLRELIYGWSVAGVSVLPVLSVAVVCLAGELFLRSASGLALADRGDRSGLGARLGGFSVVLAYLVAGCGAGIGGILLAAAFGPADVVYGAPALIQILAAIALGGGIPGHGGGSVFGSLFGALIVVATGNVLLPLGIQDYLSIGIDAGWLLIGLWSSWILWQRSPVRELPLSPPFRWGVPLLSAVCSVALLAVVGTRPEATAIAVVASGISLLAIAQTAMLRVGIIDLSMPALISGGAIATVSLANGSDLRFAVALPVLVAVSVAIGCVHGLAASKLGRPAVVVTLATSGLIQAGSAAMLVLLPTGYTPPLLHTLTVVSWLGVPVMAWIFVAAGVLTISCLHAKPASSGRAHQFLPFIFGSFASVCFGIMLAGLGGSAHISVIDSFFLPAVAAAIIAGNLATTNALPMAGCLALIVVAADTALVDYGAGYATRICVLAAALVLGEAVRAQGAST